MRMGEHRSFPKPPSRLATRMDRDRAIDRAWQALCRTVDARDHYRCRVCQRRVVKTLSLCAERLERHHLVGRWIAPQLVLDPRNLILCCAADHLRLTRHELLLKATAFYTVEGRSYPDATSELNFV
jgi:hypothetical protein